MPVLYDPMHPERSDPYPVYRRLRDEEPLHRAPELGCWIVSRFDDVLGVLKDPERFSSRAMFEMLMNNGQEGRPPLRPVVIAFLVRMVLRTRLNPLEFATARNLIAEDGERHAELRNLVNRGFTPRQIAAWEPRVREITGECVAPLVRGQGFDLIRDLAVPLPVRIIAEMLGVEPERQDDFKRWSDTIIAFSTGPGRRDPFHRRFRDALIELLAYLRKVVKARRAAPSDDLVSLLIAAQEGEARLTDREVIQFVMLLLVAGNETTTNLIGNAVHAALTDPVLREKLANDPGRIDDWIEETLRYDAPVQIVFRKATEDVPLHGGVIRTGETVGALIGSANRDERRFADADRFDLDRDRRGHLGFGFGKHFCLGASLARLEARVALEAIAPLLPRLAAPGEAVPLVDSFMVRGRETLPLRLAA